MVKQKSFWVKTNFLLIGLLLILVSFLMIKFSLRKDEYAEIWIESSAGEWWYSERLPPHWLTDSLSVGAAETDSSGRKIAEITGIQSLEEGANRVFLAKVRLLVTKNPKTNSYRFKQQILSVGSPVTIYPNNTKLIGNVISILGINDVYQEKEIKAVIKLYDRYPWFADHIKVGDRYTDPATDRTLIEVANKEVVYAEDTGHNSSGQAVATRNPRKRDIELTIKIKTVFQGSQYYFGNYQPVKVGNSLYLPMSDYNLYEVKVVSIEPNSSQ